MTYDPEVEATDRSLGSPYLAQVSGLLWPRPAVVGLDGASAPTTRSWVMVPRSDHPKLLVPAGSGRAASTVARSYSEPKSRRARLRGEALALAFRTGLADQVFRGRLRVTPGGSPTLEEHLREVFGVECLIGLHVGPARANRKPVLTLVSRDGTLLGYAKLGVDGLTNGLVRAEAVALERLGHSELRRVVVPRPLHVEVWQGAELLVQSPLPVRERRAPDDAHTRDLAVLEVAGVEIGRARLAHSPFWRSTVGTLRDLAAPTARALSDTAARIEPCAEAAAVRLGAWHGDWHPGNMAAVGESLLVWDWERFAVGVPVGSDALHYELQRAITVRGVPPERAAPDLVRSASRVLAPFGVAPGDAPVIVAAYLLHIGARYLRDDQAAAGGRLGRLEEWLVPSVVGLAESLTSVPAARRDRGDT